MREAAHSEAFAESIAMFWSPNETNGKVSS